MKVASALERKCKRVKFLFSLSLKSKYINPCVQVEYYEKKRNIKGREGRWRGKKWQVTF